MDDHDDNNDSNSYDDNQSENAEDRPNRYQGHPSTWRNFTAEDRAINISLVRPRNEDLSAHLYNAHALKRRVREAEEKQEAHDEFVPPKVWTAWPLPPEIVPREDDIIGVDDDLEQHTLRREEKYRPSRVLEDVLIGTTLRIAKERFSERESESEDEEDIQRQDGEVERAREGSHREVTDGEDEPVLVPQKLRPMISTDDEQSRNLLRPTIRHDLSRLDELLMALHYSREACLRGMSEESDMTQCNFASEDEEEFTASSPSKRQKTSRNGRGRSQRPESVPMSQPVQQTIEPPPSSQTKKSNRGRPRKEYPRLPDESDYDFAVRIARLKKQPKPPRPKSPVPEPAKSPSASARSTPSRRSRSGTPRKRRTSDADGKLDSRWQTRDWSEILGAAAIIGFPDEVIARTAQRCATLFGEGMVMRKLDHNLPPAGELINYVPQKIGPLHMESSSDEDEDGSQPSPATEKKKGKEKEVVDILEDDVTGNYRVPKAVVQTDWCPIPGCPRHTHGFGRSNHLKRHLITQHDYENPSSELAQAVAAGKGLKRAADTGPEKMITQEMEGGVHVDGYMREISATLKVGTGVAGVKDCRARKEGTGKRRWSSGRKGRSESREEEDDDDNDEDLGDEDQQQETKISPRKTRNARRLEVVEGVPDSQGPIFSGGHVDYGLGDEANRPVFVEESSGSDYGEEEQEEEDVDADED